MNTKITIKDKTGNAKMVEFNEFGSCVRILGFKRDIKRNRLSNWRAVNNEVSEYISENKQEFAEFLLGAA